VASAIGLNGWFVYVVAARVGIGKVSWEDGTYRSGGEEWLVWNMGIGSDSAEETG